MVMVVFGEKMFGQEKPWPVPYLPYLLSKKLRLLGRLNT